jgi:glycosyltransferase involved in cell wall biosynthesis
VLKHVTFTGMLEGEDKLAALAESDIFVLPSYTESFGIAIVEAMACGLPVLISKRVNIWREVVHAHAGMAVECSADDLARALLHLVDHPADRARMGNNGKLFVAERFTWTKVASDMIAAYQLAIDHRLAPESI